MHFFFFVSAFLFVPCFFFAITDLSEQYVAVKELEDRPLKKTTCATKESLLVVDGELVFA